MHLVPTPDLTRGVLLSLLNGRCPAPPLRGLFKTQSDDE